MRRSPFKNLRRSLPLVVAIAGVLAAGWPSAASAASFTITDLGTLPGGSYSAADAVNAHGEIVGYSNTASGDQHAFSYTRAGGMVDLGTLPGGVFSQATAVNNRGEIVGYAGTPTGQEHAFFYTPSRGMVDLGTLPGGSYSMATGVNDRGEVVGVADTATCCGDLAHAFSYTPKGGMIE